MSAPTKKYRYECNLCQKKFQNFCYLQRHYIVHTGEKPYECYICHNKFSFTFNLKSHFIRNHPGEKPFECSICQLRFYEGRQLKKHAKIHTGENQIECDNPIRKFKSSSGLNGRIEKYKGKQKFKNPSRFQKYGRVQTGDYPHKCNLCNEVFIRRAFLKSHQLRVHNIGHLPKCCVFCNKRFNFECELHNHIRCHLEEKPFFCNVCGQEFGYTQNRDLHVAKYHGSTENYIEEEESGTLQSDIINETDSSRGLCRQRKFFVYQEIPEEPVNMRCLVQHSIPILGAVMEFGLKPSGILVISTELSSITCQKLHTTLPGITVFHKPEDCFSSSIPGKVLVCDENYDCVLIEAYSRNDRILLVISKPEQVIKTTIKQVLGIRLQQCDKIKVMRDTFQWSDLTPYFQLRVLRNWTKIFGFSLGSHQMECVEGQFLMQLINNKDFNTLQDCMPWELRRYVNQMRMRQTHKAIRENARMKEEMEGKTASTGTIGDSKNVDDCCNGIGPIIDPVGGDMEETEVRGAEKECNTLELKSISPSLPGECPNQVDVCTAVDNCSKNEDGVEAADYVTVKDKDKEDQYDSNREPVILPKVKFEPITAFTMLM